jgi:hypothetical protein
MSAGGGGTERAIAKIANAKPYRRFTRVNADGVFTAETRRRGENPYRGLTRRNADQEKPNLTTD